MFLLMLLVSGRRRLSHLGIWRSRIEILKEAHKTMSLLSLMVFNLKLIGDR